jgi:hypothetical protein
MIGSPSWRLIKPPRREAGRRGLMKPAADWPSDRVRIVVDVTSAAGSGFVVSGPFEAGVRVDGGVVRRSLADLSLGLLRRCEPVRRPGVYRRQRHMPGRWFSTTAGRFLEYESLLERDWIDRSSANSSLPPSRDSPQAREQPYGASGDASPAIIVAQVEQAPRPGVSRPGPGTPEDRSAGPRCSA